MAPWQDALRALERALAVTGFDLCAPARVGSYNARLADRPQYRLPDLGDAAHLVVLIGNTRALWPRLLSALATDSKLRASAHPVDDYCRACVGAAATELARALGVEHALRFASDALPAAVAIQRLAEVSGLCEIAPCNLAIHPEYGPWLSLRAAVVIAIAGPLRDPPRPDPCGGCAARPCVPALERAVEAGAAPPGVPWDARHDRWLAVRDACPVGRVFRYPAEQIDYHYAKDRVRLIRLARTPSDS